MIKWLFRIPVLVLIVFFTSPLLSIGAHNVGMIALADAAVHGRMQVRNDDWFARAVAWWSDNTQAVRAMAESKLWQGDTEKATSLLSNAQLGTGTRFILFRRLMTWGSDREALSPHTAEEMYLLATEIMPDSSEPYYALGQFYTQRVRYEDAIRAFRQAIGVEPVYAARGYLYIGRVYMRQKQWKDAIRALELAVAHSSPDAWAVDWESAEVHLNLGEAWFNLGNQQTAVEEFHQVIGLNPASSWLLGSAWFRLGQIYRRERRYDLSIKALEQAIEIRPDYKWAYVILGHVYVDLGKMDKAATMYAQALDLDPKLDEARQALDALGR